MPTEAEIQTQWRNAVDVLETARAHADGTMAPAAGKFDVLLQSLEGDYTPVEIAAAVARYRATYSALLDPGTALQFLSPLLLDYAAILAAEAGIAGFGSGYRDSGDLFSALYEYFVATTKTVQSRNITFDSTVTTGKSGPSGGSIVGNGAMSRLTTDRYGFAIEACHVERKLFRCRQDQNTGVEKEAEVFEHLGANESQDALLRSSFGSGRSSIAFLRSHHAGSGAGGSLLNNSTFSTFLATATPKFTGWTETAGGAQLAQDTTNFYRSHPGASTDAALKITGGAGTVTVKQALDEMRVRRLDSNTPYFLRVMLNKTVGTASGGTVTIRMGSVTASVTIAALGAGWQELLITAGEDSWPTVFGQDPLDVEIEWSSSTSGFLLVDDVLFAPFDLVDGTWWFLRANNATPIAWEIDDLLQFTDTGGAPTTGKVQWWLFVAGLGYLPSTTGTPTFADP